MSKRGWFVTCLVILIVAAHVALWRSDMETGLKLAFTTLNFIGWAIVLVPILFVDRWLDAVKRRNADNISSMEQEK